MKKLLIKYKNNPIIEDVRHLRDKKLSHKLKIKEIILHLEKILSKPTFSNV